MVKEFLCRNGETVLVADDGSATVRVLYQGRTYFRPRSILGKTLFEKIEVDLNRFVDVEACETGEILHLYMAETECKTEYRRMGGSYYGATVDVKDVISDQLCLPEGVTPITCHSPIGKALLHKKAGDTVEVRTPDNGEIQYKVLMVRNTI